MDLPTASQRFEHTLVKGPRLQPSHRMPVPHMMHPGTAPQVLLHEPQWQAERHVKSPQTAPAPVSAALHDPCTCTEHQRARITTSEARQCFFDFIYCPNAVMLSVAKLYSSPMSFWHERAVSLPV